MPVPPNAENLHGLTLFAKYIYMGAHELTSFGSSSFESTVLMQVSLNKPGNLPGSQKKNSLNS